MLAAFIFAPFLSRENSTKKTIYLEIWEGEDCGVTDDCEILLVRVSSFLFFVLTFPPNEIK